MHALSGLRWSVPFAVAGALASALVGCGDVVVPADAGGSSTTSTSDAAGTVCRDLCGTPDCGECPTNPMIDAGAYRIDATEVTVGAYKAFFATHPVLSDVLVPGLTECADREYYLDEYVLDDPDDMPIAVVTWCDAFGYCTWARKHLCGKIGGGGNYPPEHWTDATQSEWFNACSAGGTKTFPYGDVYEPETCNGADDAIPYEATVYETACEGGLPGLRDMSGNLQEWDFSCVDSGLGLDCNVRGGTADDTGPNLACDWTVLFSPVLGGRGIGFRCCE